MPGLITNYLFGEQAYQALSSNYLKEIINKNTNAYRMGLQGPDIFYYYLSPYMRKRKNNICNILHEKNTGIFIDNMLEYRMQVELEHHPELHRDAFCYRRLETLMDSLLLKRMNHMEPSQLNLEALVSVNKKERKNISDCLLYALRTTYHYRLSRKTLLKVIRSVRRTCIFLQTNPQMRQRLIYFFEKRLRMHMVKD